MAQEDETRDRRYAAPALEKGLDILECLSTEEAGLTQSEIARALGRSVSEVFRMIVVLQERQYLTLDPLSDRYALTTRLFEIAHRIPRIKRLTTLAGPIMQRLARAVHQSAHLAILSEDGIVVVGQVDSPDNNTMSVRLGAKIELWRASSGRVILAWQPEEVLAGYLARVPLPQGMSEAQIRAELATIRATGHEVRDSFVARGIVNISCPVFDHSGQTTAALTIPYLEKIGDTVTLDACRTALIAAARAMSQGLGGGTLQDQS